MTDLLSQWAWSLDGLPAPTPPAVKPSGKAASSWSTVTDWLAELSRQQARMRASTPHYNRFDRTARWLTAGRIRVIIDYGEAAGLAGLLREARSPSSALHGLDRVWSRAELGVLVTEATNRARQLAMGRLTLRVRGPRFDPARLPDDRLLLLIQRHRDLRVVEALREERRRREAARNGALGL